MPFPRQHFGTTTQLVPLGSGSVGLATSTTEDKLAIPAKTRAIRVVGGTVKHLVGIGASSTPPSLSTTNAVILQVGGEGETIYLGDNRRGVTTQASGSNQNDSYTSGRAYQYLYFKAASSTGTIDISFYG